MSGARRDCGPLTIVHDEQRRPGCVRLFDTRKPGGPPMADLSPRADAETPRCGACRHWSSPYTLAPNDEVWGRGDHCGEFDAPPAARAAKLRKPRQTTDD